MTENLDDYILSHITPEPEHLRRLYRRTHLRHLYPRMCSGHLQGRLLAMISAMVSPRRILELGTYTGYSALCLAEGLRPDGRLHTVEIDDEMEEEPTELFATAPGGDRITLHIGDAETIVNEIDEEWDLVYIDANKRRYVEYLDAVLPLGRQSNRHRHQPRRPDPRPRPLQQLRSRPPLPRNRHPPPPRRPNPPPQTPLTSSSPPRQRLHHGAAPHRRTKPAPIPQCAILRLAPHNHLSHHHEKPPSCRAAPWCSRQTTREYHHTLCDNTSCAPWSRPHHLKTLGEG